MKLSSLLAQRQTLLQQARLANLAFAHHRLSGLTERITRARIRGEVRLRHAAPDAELHWPTLTALQGNQSVIEEHFTDVDIADLADVIAFAKGVSDVDFTIPIETLAERFLPPLRNQLEQAGVALDENEPHAGSVHLDDSNGGPHTRKLM
jgi:hypothetical protein